ncbi:SDR family oxidoreductase [Haladaptatus pallidirubidus]|uniref:SDR family oxidoreductase n=1 Tax=Haladaptatus pallidirubidus TaxID=1008152 RepID=UPI0035EF36F6
MAGEAMTSPILVTGGTGRVGSLVVSRLRDADREVRVLSRRSHDSKDGIEFVTGDLDTGEGIEAAVNGIGTIVHCASSVKGDEDKARTLMQAASQAGVQHLVYISIVGIDEIPVDSIVGRIMFSPIASQQAAEKVVADSDIPWTTLRATQFHQLILTVAEGMAKLPVMPVPAGFQFQPVDADEVAARLVELALGEPAGMVPDMGGPQVYDMTDLLREYLRARHRRRLIMPILLPGKAAHAYRDGVNLLPSRPWGIEPGRSSSKRNRGTPDLRGISRRLVS